VSESVCVCVREVGVLIVCPTLKYVKLALLFDAQFCYNFNDGVIW
jgi:hypothetical protein